MKLERMDNDSKAKAVDSSNNQRRDVLERDRRQHIEQVKRQILEHVLNSNPTQWK